MRVAAALWRNMPLFLLAAAWEAASRLGLISTSVLPPLSQVLASWLELAASGELLQHGAISLYRSFSGLALAIVAGIGLGVAMAWWKPIRLALSGLVELFYPLPKSALIPVTALWFGFGDASKMLLIFLACLLPVTVAAFNGARSSEEALIWSARNMGASRLRTLWDVALPSALPEIVNGCRTALALSFILLVSSELVVSQAGFGHLIGSLGSMGNYTAMFAVVLTVALLGFAADRVYQAVTERLLAWRE